MCASVFRYKCIETHIIAMSREDYPLELAEAQIVIQGYRWLYVGYRWLYMVIQGYRRLYVVIDGYMWLYRVIDGYTG